MRTKKIFFGVAALSAVLLISACDNITSSMTSNDGSSTSTPLSTSDGLNSSVIGPSSTSSSVVKPDSSPISSSDVSTSLPPSSSSTASTQMTGEGTAVSPYVIDNIDALYHFADFVNSGKSTSSTYYSLTSSIDMTESPWTPVGSVDHPFTGHFNGNGHAIENLSFKAFDPGDEIIGFFGYGADGSISNLAVTGLDIDLRVIGNGSIVFVGGLIAYGENVYIDQVSIDIHNFKIESYQNNNSQVAAGGIAGLLSAGNNTYVDLKNSMVKGDLIFDMSNSADTVSVAAGLVAMVSTSFGEGVYAINNSFYQGNVTCGTYAAGIVADIDVYCSIVNTIAMGDSIYASDTEGAYAAGIVAVATYETALIGNYADYKTVTAALSSNTYKSSAGDIAAIVGQDGYDMDLDMRGTALFKNYAAPTLTVEGDNSHKYGESSEANDALYAEKLSLSSKVWNLPLNISNPFVSDIEDYDVTVTFDSNYTEGTDTTLKVSATTYDIELANKAENDTYSRGGYSYYGYCYDAEGTIEYRWYVPINTDMTLYAGWADLTPLVGNYDYICMYYGNPIGSGGHFVFTESTFYWLNEFDVSTYKYHFNGSYIFIGESLGQVVGSYVDSIFTYNTDGTITGYDLNDMDAVYTATKTNATIAIPDYTDASFLGVWYSSSLKLTLYSDGNASTLRNGSEAHYFGGYRMTNNVMSIKIFGGYTNTNVVYDADKDVMIGSDGSVFTREVPDATYATDNKSVIVVVTPTNQYVFIDKAVSSLTVEGELVDGSTVTIGDATYTVNGTVLTLKEVVQTKDYVGTWTGTLGANSFEIVLNADGSGIYDGNVITYTADGNTISIVGNDYVVLTYSKVGDVEKLHVVFDDYDTKLETDFTRKTTTDPEPDVPGPDVPTPTIPTVESVSGTYVGTWGSAGVQCTLILNADGTASISNGVATVTFNWTVDSTGKLTITNLSDPSYSFDELELTYSSDEGEVIVGTIVQDYEYTLNISVTKQTGSSDPTDVPGYIGTWKGKVGSNNWTIIIRNDGTVSYNGTEGTYTAEGNVLTINQGGITLVMTYTEENGSAKLNVVYSDDDYNEFSGDLTKQ